MTCDILANHLPALPRILADFWLPKPASNLAGDVDWAWNIILWVTGAFFCIVVGAMTFFVFAYKRKTPDDVTSPITHNTPIEIAWTVIPLILVIMFFFVGFKGFLNYDTPPSDCVVVDATAQKWSFSFQYPNGATAPDLYVLVGQDVRINMQSKDVLHALYLPDFRTQRNFVPGRQTYIWFKPTVLSPKSIDKNDPGGWPIYCTQYCGNGHSRMIARIYVLTKPEYDEKMAELANPFVKKLPNGDKRYIPYSEVGEKLYKEIGCNACHTVDGSQGTGPTWKGLYKSNVEFSYKEPGNYTLAATDPDAKWDDYFKESMLRPDVKLAIGGKAANGMPSFSATLAGSEVNEEKQRALAEYIKSIGNQNYTKPDDTGAAWDAVKNPHHPQSAAAATQTRPAGQ
jgi:cytochrome c oxidase subunit 2